jgi:hypothetical protein
MFCILKPTMLPLDARKKFQLHWMPIFSLMEGSPDLEILPVMDTDSISLSFSVGKQYLKARVSYAFENEQAKPDQWGISTCSKKVARSSILKNGNVSDKAHLPAATRHNQPRQQRNPRNRPLADLRRTCRQVEIAIDDGEPAATNDGDGDTTNDGNGDTDEEPTATDDGDCDTDEEPAATNDGDRLLPDDGDGLLLPDVNLTATANARGEEIEREVSEEMTVELREHRWVTNVGRPDGHGGVIFIGPQF